MASDALQILLAAVKSKRTQREYEAKTKQDADTRAIRAVLARKSKTLEH